jgi:hypothetical protein
MPQKVGHVAPFCMGFAILGSIRVDYVAQPANNADNTKWFAIGECL